MYHVSVFLLVLAVAQADYKYDTKWFQVPLDHFGYQRNETFQIKYLVNETYWDKTGGPIFFYTGNEGQIEVFAQYTGFMWDIAREFGAKIVFAEHRYYGASKPFGNNSLSNENIGYLTASQALADFADLISYLQGGEERPTYPVVAFGGSYGGMLATYLRIKYPHIVDGTIAASAPIHMYAGMVPCEAFTRIVTSSFTIASKNCAANIKNSWNEIRNFTTNANNTAWLQKEWRLCDPIKNDDEVQNLIDFLSTMYTTLAMVNYPYPSDFLLSLPGQPVRVVCQYLNESLSGMELIQGIGKVLETFSNYNKKNKCVNYKKRVAYDNLDTSGWDYQACTEMVMPSCANGVDDLFEITPWDMKLFFEDCHEQYNVYPRPDAARISYGGDRLSAASNIVFSNGLLDPWSAGGILNSVSSTVKAVVMIDAAHHLDLMPQNEKDPSSVKMVREVHKENIRSWIKEFRDRREDELKNRG